MTQRRSPWCVVIVLAALVCGVALLPFPLSRTAVADSANRADRTDPAELQMLDLINRDRSAASSQEETRGRARSLTWDAKLAAVARAHSEEMARYGFLSHQGADGSMPSQRVSAAGIQWISTGENIANAYDVSQAERLLMNEPKFQHNHRANILNPNYNRVGIGISRAPDETIYITQEFAQVP